LHETVLRFKGAFIEVQMSRDVEQTIFLLPLTSSATPPASGVSGIVHVLSSVTGTGPGPATFLLLVQVMP